MLCCSDLLELTSSSLPLVSNSIIHFISTFWNWFCIIRLLLWGIACPWTTQSLRHIPACGVRMSNNPKALYIHVQKLHFSASVARPGQVLSWTPAISHIPSTCHFIPKWSFSLIVLFFSFHKFNFQPKLIDWYSLTKWVSVLRLQIS